MAFGFTLGGVLTSVNAGRPLRFLAIVLSGWAAMRVVAIYRDDATYPPLWIAPAARAAAAFDVPPAPIAAPAPAAAPATRPEPAVVGRQIPRPTAVNAASPEAKAHPMPVRGPAAPFRRKNDDPPAMSTPFVTRLSASVALPPPIARGGPRLIGSAWLIARGGAPGVAAGSQLGASQAGARLTYALGESRRLALAARFSAPLSGRGKEAAIGLDWQPMRAPVHILVERRFALDGAHDGTMIGIVGGFGPVTVRHGLRIEGYGQAGAIARDGMEGFADGALRAAHPVANLGGIGLDIGAGVWGGAQRGAARLDVGPSLGVVVPVGRGSIRLTADWRERVAGGSRPGSGPALSIGTNF